MIFWKALILGRDPHRIDIRVKILSPKLCNLFKKRKALTELKNYILTTKHNKEI
jgi:hypothetical protein